MKQYTISYKQAMAGNTKLVFWLCLLQRLRLMLLSLTRIHDILVLYQLNALQVRNTRTTYTINFSIITHESH